MGNSNEDFGRRVMEIMDEITLDDAADSNLKRDNANINGDTSMGAMLQYGANTAKEYYLRRMIDPCIAEMHRDGIIHIHDLDFYGWTTTCTQIELRSLFRGGFDTGHGHLREPQSIGSYAALAAIAIQSNQNDQHGGQSIIDFDYAMGDGVLKTYNRYLREAFDIQSSLLNSGDMDYKTDVKWREKYAMDKTRRDTYQAMEGLIHNLNTMHSRAGAQTPFSSINYGMDTSWQGRLAIEQLLLATEAGLGDGETPIFPIQIFRVKEGINFNPGEPNYDLFRLAMRVSAKRLFPNFSFIDAPFNLQYYRPGHPETEVGYMGCVDGDEYVSYRMRGRLFVESFARAFERIRGSVDASNVHQNPNGTAWIDLEGEDVEVWDGAHCDWAKVRRTVCNPDTGNWAQINLSNGRLLRATLDHPLPTLEAGRTPVEKLRPGMSVPVSTSQPRSYAEQRYPSAWLMGLILCDGCYKSVLTICVGLDEKDIADSAIASLLAIGFERVKVELRERGEKGTYYEIRLVGDQAALRSKLVSEFGGVTKAERRVPVEVFEATADDRMRFLAGMIDADGHIAVRQTERGHGYRVQLGSTNRELALGQMALAQSLGLPAKIYENAYKASEPDKVRYRVEFGLTKGLCARLHCGKKRTMLQDPDAYAQNAVVDPWGKVVSVTRLGHLGRKSYDFETASDMLDISGIHSHNCRTRVMGNVCGEEVAPRRGNLSFTSINLPYLAISARNDTGFRPDVPLLPDDTRKLFTTDEQDRIDRFTSMLDEALDVCHTQLMDRFKVQSNRKAKNFPFLMGQGVWKDAEKLGPNDPVGEVLKHGTLSIGFVGLAETLVALIGEHHGQSERAQKLGLAIVTRIRSYCDWRTKTDGLNFTCLATPAESLAGKFARLNRQTFGEIAGVTDREYLTNSFHVPVYFPISAFHKVRIEAPYHALTNAGHITYVEMDGDPSRNLDAFEAVIRHMKNCGIGYGSVNHPVDRDPCCGYNGIIGDVCPKCGRRECKCVVKERVPRIRK